MCLFELSPLHRNSFLFTDSRVKVDHFDQAHVFKMFGKANNRFQHKNKSKDKRPKQKDFQGKGGKEKRKDLLLSTNNLEQIDTEIASLKKRYEEVRSTNNKFILRNLFLFLFNIFVVQ